MLQDLLNLLDQVNVQSLLNVLLAAGIFSIVADAFISHRRAAAARKRELHGLLRLLLVEIKTNDRLMETLMGKHASALSHVEKFEDETWKEGRVRLAQLLPNEHHFHHLNIYYRNNTIVEVLAFELVRRGMDIGDPKHYPVAVARKLLEQQREMGRTSLEIILKYVPEDPARFHTQEYVDEQIKRIERTLEAPQEPSGGPPSGVLGRSPAPVA